MFVVQLNDDDATIVTDGFVDFASRAVVSLAAELVVTAVRTCENIVCPGPIRVVNPFPVCISKLFLEAASAVMTRCSSHYFSFGTLNVREFWCSTVTLFSRTTS